MTTTVHPRGRCRRDRPTAPSPSPAAPGAGSTAGTPRTPSSGGEGRAIARRNLGWSIFAEFLGFIVWQLWSIVVVMLPAAGFDLTSSQSFWLISLPSLVGATMRFPYTFMVAIRRAQLDDRLGGAPADPRHPPGVRRRQPRHPVRGAAARRGTRGLRRRQLRQLHGQHHLLLPAEGEGLGTGPERRGRQPRHVGGAVRRADRRHDRRGRDAEHLARGMDVDPAHPPRDLGRVAVHGQPVQCQGRRRGLRRGAS